MESSEEVPLVSSTNKILSPRDTTKVSVVGEDFNPDELAPIPVPRLRSQDVPKKLPSALTLHRRGVTSARPEKSPPVHVPVRVTSSPLRRTSTQKSPKRIRVARLSARDLDKGKSIVRSARSGDVVIVSSSNRIPTSSNRIPTSSGRIPLTSNRVPLTSQGREKVVSIGLPLTPAPPLSISDMPVYREERVVRVIRAAPKGFLNIPNIPDYSILSETQQEAMRAKFDMKLQVIKKNKPGLPDFGKEEPLHIIHVKYDQYVRQAHIDKTIVKYKVYLTIIFLIIEAIGCKIFNIPIAGYTSDQLNQFIFYEQFLMEIAERQKEGGGDEWPVEVRIFIFMIFQAVIFIIIKLISGILPVEATASLRAQINEFMMPSKGVVVDSDGIAEPPSSGFDPTGLLNMVSSFIGGSGNKTNKPAADVTKHTLPFDD